MYNMKIVACDKEGKLFVFHGKWTSPSLRILSIFPVPDYMMICALCKQLLHKNASKTLGMENSYFIAFQHYNKYMNMQVHFVVIRFIKLFMSKSILLYISFLIIEEVMYFFSTIICMDIKFNYSSHFSF